MAFESLTCIYCDLDMCKVANDDRLISYLLQHAHKACIKIIT